MSLDGFVALEQAQRKRHSSISSPAWWTKMDHGLELMKTVAAPKATHLKFAM